MRVGGGANATLSIPRDTVVDIPGHGRNKINAAYALGGPSLAIKTVESYLGIDVNHLVEVNFENFPQLIDSLGGVTYKGGCVVSQDQRRHAQRRLHAAAEGGRARDRRQAGARARAHAQERVRPAARTTAPAPAASRRSSRAIKRQGHLARDLRPPAVGQLGRAARRPVRHGRPVAARPRRRRADRRRGAARACSSPRAASRCPTEAPVSSWTTPRSSARSSAS